MSDLTHVAHFGDGEKSFRLTPEMITELERKAGAGIGALIRRVFNQEFSQADIHETIRLALIGGGQSPKDADALVAAYAINRPFIETFPLALAILETTWFGVANREAPDASV